MLTRDIEKAQAGSCAERWGRERVLHVLDTAGTDLGLVRSPARPGLLRRQKLQGLGLDQMRGLQHAGSAVLFATYRLYDLVQSTCHLCPRLLLCQISLAIPPQPLHRHGDEPVKT